MKNKSYEIYGAPNSVRVPKDGIEGAIKLWKKRLYKNDTIQKLRDRKHYVKPSVTKRKQKNDAEFNQQCESNRFKQYLKNSNSI